jgi:succinoglycan biosynthesis transport protein ExoP
MAELAIERHEATLRDYLGIVFRQKWVILSLVAIPTIVVLLQTIGSQVMFKSTSTVLLRRGQRESAIVPYVTVLPWEEQVSSEEQTATSVVVITKAQEILDEWQSDLPEEQRTAIRGSSVEAGIVGESNVLAISYVDHKPAVAKQVTQALTEAYIRYREETSLAPGLLSFFDGEIEERRNSLVDLRVEREQFMAAKGVNDLEWRTRMLLDLWRELSSKLSDAVSERAAEEAGIAEMKRLLENPDVATPVLSQGPPGSETVMNKLRSSRSVLRMDLQRLKAQYTDKDQRVIAVQRQLGDVEEQLKAEVKQELILAEARVAPLRAAENQIRQSLSAVEVELRGYPEQETVLADLNAKIRVLERDYETLTGKKIDAMVSRESSPEWTVILLSPASEPVALRTKDYVRLSLGPLLGLLVGIGLAFLFDSLDHSIKSKGEAEAFLEIPVVASIVEMKEWEKK